jgi:hypothetical protein
MHTHTGGGDCNLHFFASLNASFSAAELYDAQGSPVVLYLFSDLLVLCADRSDREHSEIDQRRNALKLLKLAEYFLLDDDVTFLPLSELDGAGRAGFYIALIDVAIGGAHLAASAVLVLAIPLFPSSVPSHPHISLLASCSLLVSFLVVLLFPPFPPFFLAFLFLFFFFFFFFIFFFFFLSHSLH